MRHTEQIRQIRKIRQIRDHALLLAAALKNRKNTPGKRILRILRITRIAPQRGLFHAPGHEDLGYTLGQLLAQKASRGVFTKVICILGATAPGHHSIGLVRFV